MTGEEMERAIEFLVKSQAAHDTRLDQLTAQVTETSKQLQMYAETQSQFIQIVTRTLEAQAEVNASLRAAIARTDERLERLEVVVERIVEGRA